MINLMQIAEDQHKKKLINIEEKEGGGKENLEKIDEAKIEEEDAE